MHRRSALTLALLLAVLSGASSAQAADPPLLAGDTLPGHAWFSYRFHLTETARVSYQIEGDVSNSTTTGLGYWRLLEDGSLASGFGFVQFGNGEQRHIQLQAPIGTLESTNTNSSSSSPGLSSGGTFDPGTYTVVLMVASSGDVSQSRASISGDAGVTILEASSGTNVFMNWEGDFEGVANVVATRPPARAAAAVAATVTETVEAPLFGWFTGAPYGTQAARLTWHGPGGSTGSAISGLQPGYHFFSGLPKGSYDFTIDASAGAVLASTTAFGAGVTLP